MKMHEGEVDIDLELVGRLVADQFPELADLPLRAVESTGTVNAIYRLGDDLCVRLPLLAKWVESLEKEWRWLPELAPRLSLPVPQPVVRGRPQDRYPFPWAVLRWIDGAPYSDDLVDDERRAAQDLGQFVLELRAIDPVAGAPAGGRRPLAELDGVTRATLQMIGDVVNLDAATAVWEQSLRAPVWNGRPRWIHADLLRPNLLVHEGRLSAVIDFGSGGVGDPAGDVIAAWSVFGATGRPMFRDVLAVDDGTWRRARGMALHQAAGIIAYYRQTNPAFVAQAMRTVQQIQADVVTES